MDTIKIEGDGLTTLNLNDSGTNWTYRTMERGQKPVLPNIARRFFGGRYPIVQEDLTIKVQATTVADLWTAVEALRATFDYVALWERGERQTPLRFVNKVGSSGLNDDAHYPIVGLVPNATSAVTLPVDAAETAAANKTIINVQVSFLRTGVGCVDDDYETFVYNMSDNTKKQGDIWTFNIDGRVQTPAASILLKMAGIENLTGSQPGPGYILAGVNGSIGMKNLTKAGTTQDTPARWSTFSGGNESYNGDLIYFQPTTTNTEALSWLYSVGTNYKQIAVFGSFEQDNSDHEYVIRAFAEANGGKRYYAQPQTINYTSPRIVPLGVVNAGVPTVNIGFEITPKTAGGLLKMDVVGYQALDTGEPHSIIGYDQFDSTQYGLTYGEVYDVILNPNLWGEARSITGINLDGVPTAPVLAFREANDIYAPVVMHGDRTIDIINEDIAVLWLCTDGLSWCATTGSRQTPTVTMAYDPFVAGPR